MRRLVADSERPVGHVQVRNEPAKTGKGWQLGDKAPASFFHSVNVSRTAGPRKGQKYKGPVMAIGQEVKVTAT